MEDAMNTDQNNWVLGCQICGTQDETIKVISFPYVISLLVVSFQRAFSGVYCRKHQRRYHILSSVITSTIGWLGIPYGLIMTPLTLFKLARGGEIHKPASIQLLTAISEKKLKEGDRSGAIRCLEKCLKLDDNQEIQDKLTKLYQFNRSNVGTGEMKFAWGLLTIPLLLIFSFTIGLIVGLIEIVFDFLLAPFFTGEVSIFLAILSWIPTVVLIFLAILATRATLRWVLNKNEQVTNSLGLILAFLSTIFTFYSILEGEAVLRNLQGLFTFYTVSSNDGIFAIRSVLSHGGLDVFINNITQGDLPNTIFLTLFIVGFGVSIFSGVEIITQTVRWQNIITRLKDSLGIEISLSSTPKWLVLGLILLSFLIIDGLIYPGEFVNIENAHSQLNIGFSELDQEHFDNAVLYFSKAKEAWPHSVTSHVYLGLGYVSQLKFDQAEEELNEALRLDENSMIVHFFKGSLLVSKGDYSNAVNEFIFVSDMQQEWGTPHATLAILYYFLDETDLAKQEIDLAIANENNDSQTSSTISSYYYQTTDFAAAEKYALRAIESDYSSSNYLTLIQIYMSQYKLDEAEQLIDDATQKGMDPITIYLAKSHLAGFQRDYQTAKALLTEALEMFPNNTDLLYEMGFIELQLGNTKPSIAYLEKTLELDQSNFIAYTDLAFAYYEDSNLDKATTLAIKGATLTPKYDRIHYILGLCYKDKGMTSDSVKEFETFLDLYWERPLTQELKANAENYLDQLK